MLNMNYVHLDKLITINYCFRETRFPDVSSKSQLVMVPFFMYNRLIFEFGSCSCWFGHPIFVVIWCVCTFVFSADYRFSNPRLFYQVISCIHWALLSDFSSFSYQSCWMLAICLHGLKPILWPVWGWCFNGAEAGCLFLTLSLISSL